MDRLNKVHLASRVQLPPSVLNFDQANLTPPERPRVFTILSRYVGIACFLTCGAAVIATATALALSIQ